LNIIHFNDVYNLAPRYSEPVGGAARFISAVEALNHLNPLVIFSGDALNPSALSAVTKGRQFIPIFSMLNVSCAVYGNHDFDFGADNLMNVVEQMNFPWLLSNVHDIMTGQPLAQAHKKIVIEWANKRIGFMGLIEKEWLDAVSTIDEIDVEYIDYITQGNQIARYLREHDRVDYVIALTHMRWPNDLNLAKHCQGIDLILGGHDHDYDVRKVRDVYIVKSGTDFQHFSLINIAFDQHSRTRVKIECKQITSDIPESPAALTVIEHFDSTFDLSMYQPLGNVLTDMDGRHTIVRMQESSLGNFITDIISTGIKCDGVILNSGAFRSNRIHQAGPFTYKDMFAIVPMMDSLVVFQMTDSQVLSALENGVSRFPNRDGRFPQVSGIKFHYNPAKSPGSRVLYQSIRVAGQPLSSNKRYLICTSEFLAQGKDGYQVFTRCPVYVHPDDTPSIYSLIENFFESVDILMKKKEPQNPHWQGILNYQKLNHIFIIIIIIIIIIITIIIIIIIIIIVIKYSKNKLLAQLMASCEGHQHHHQGGAVGGSFEGSGRVKENPVKAQQRSEVKYGGTKVAMVVAIMMMMMMIFM
ncbi:hypothetical protein HELRODRAFT_69219, partial [Helobdella robusta]